MELNFPLGAACPAPVFGWGQGGSLKLQRELPVRRVRCESLGALAEFRGRREMAGWRGVVAGSGRSALLRPGARDSVSPDLSFLKPVI